MAGDMFCPRQMERMSEMQIQLKKSSCSPHPHPLNSGNPVLSSPPLKKNISTKNILFRGIKTRDTAHYACHDDDGVFLACEDFWGRFNNLFPTCALAPQQPFEYCRPTKKELDKKLLLKLASVEGQEPLIQKKKKEKKQAFLWVCLLKLARDLHWL